MSVYCFFIVDILYSHQLNTAIAKQPHRDPAEEVISVRFQTNSGTVRLRCEYDLDPTQLQKSRSETDSLNM